jgi:hypothetical protein
MSASTDTLSARLRTYLRADLRPHREFIAILVLFVVFRLTAVVVFKPGGYLGEMSDFGYYRLLLSFTNQGYYPLIDFWVEYPPIFPWLMVGLYRLSLLIPAWTQAGTWFYLLLSGFLTLVEAGNLILIYALARRLFNRERAVRLAWIYTALLIPVLALFVGFDSLALFFLLLAVLLTLGRHPVGTGVAAGLGFMTKLLPIVAIPAAWQHMKEWRQRIVLGVATLLSMLLVALPFLVTGPAYLFQSLKSPVIRSTWETVWALIDGYYSYGVAGGVDRFDPAMAGAAQHPTRLPWAIITVGFLLFYLALYTRKVDWSDGRRVVAFTALTQNLLTLYFKGYSPQFLIMLLPFVLLLIPGWRGIAYALLLSVINLVEYPVYFVVLPDEHWVLTGTILLRTLILIVLSVEYAAQVYSWRVTEKVWSRIATAVTALVLVLGVMGAIFGLRAYSQAQYDTSPHRGAIEALSEEARPGAQVVTEEQVVYEHLYPLLHGRLDVALVETFDYLPAWELRLAEAAAQSEGELWIYAPADSLLHDWAAVRYPPITRHESEGWLLTGWDTR